MCRRSEAIGKYQLYFKEQGLDKEIGDLIDKDILCHCRPEKDCQGDLLLGMAR